MNELVENLKAVYRDRLRTVASLAGDLRLHLSAPLEMRGTTAA